MFPRKAHSLGGITTAKINREKALKSYYDNPNKCLSCGDIIHIGDRKVTEVKKKKFCNHSCAAIFNNAKFPKRKRTKKPPSSIRKTGRNWAWLIGLTKEEIFKKHKNWQSARSSIRVHAQHTYMKKNTSGICEACGYDKHIEVCHKKSVSLFSDYDVIDDINHIDNLIGLCPNCHWEFDHGLLNIASRSSDPLGLISPVETGALPVLATKGIPS